MFENIFASNIKYVFIVLHMFLYVLYISILYNFYVLPF